MGLQKAFELCPTEITMRLLEHTGMPKPIVKALRGFYSGIKCVFAHGGVVGEWFRKTAGLFQGCPWSMLAMSNMTTVWAHLVDRQQVQPMGYVDDLNLIAKG